MIRPFTDATRRTIVDCCRNFPRTGIDDSATPLKRAAVALVLTHAATGDGTALLLTLRSSGLRAHSNQWALPGGRCDPGETAIATALRELHEELGLRLSPDDVIGTFDDYPTRSGYLITPVLMWAANSERLDPNPDEVASVHRIALTDIERHDAFDFIDIPESHRRVIRYDHFGDYIHAPTAAMIYQFSESLAGRVTRVAELEQPVFAWK
jgi:8-oxo-dGTP pyrophosphatase MutT (NUDIX family)